MYMRAVHRRYLREFFPAIFAYCALIVVSLRCLHTLEGKPARAAVTLLPVVPVAFLIRAMVRAIRDQDELERRIDLESTAIGGAIAGFGFFTYGMLLKSGVLPVPPGEAVAIWVLPVLLGCFGLVKLAVRIYYRAR
jgi:hypothetical protein